LHGGRSGGEGVNVGALWLHVKGKLWDLPRMFNNNPSSLRGQHLTFCQVLGRLCLDSEAN
jgi:hypothetical protein